MKKFIKILGIIFSLVIIFVVAFVIYFNTTYPKVDPPSTEVVEATPERLARGKYLAINVTGCIACHSTRDWTMYAGPIVPGNYGKGGEILSDEFGTIIMNNITPYGISDWTDGELMRLITNGVTKDNKAVFPIMPYLSYNNLTEEDLYSIVAYIRSLEPIENTVPESSLNFPLNFIIKTIPPQSYNPSHEVDRNNKIAYGKYLTKIAVCGDCHTPFEKGEPIKGLEFAGGNEFKFPFGTVRSVNITPDEDTGIGVWDVDDFVDRFKNFDPDSSEAIPVEPDEFNTPMPWTMYAGMTREDLASIYEYLKTLKPVNNEVERFTEPGAEFRR